MIALCFVALLELVGVEGAALDCAESHNDNWTTREYFNSFSAYVL